MYRTQAMHNHEMTYRERSRRSRAARARYVDRCRVLLFGAMAAMVLITAFTTAVIRSKASSSEADTAYKYYKNIVVSYDYDLDDAAAEYADEHYGSERAYLREVCSINHLATSDVTPGTHVIVPYYASDFR